MWMLATAVASRVPRLVRSLFGSSKTRAQVVFVLGGPGAGKGTQCALLVQRLGFVHLSAGDLLRAERTSGSPTAALINEIISRGDIVPGEITTGLLKNAMDSATQREGKRYFLIDGFPRNEDNCQHWDSVVGDSADVKMVLFLDTTMEVCTERVLKRAASASGGAVRSDDNLEVLKRRFENYEAQSRPVIEAYGDTGLVCHIDAGRDVEEVYTDVAKAIKEAVLD